MKEDRRRIIGRISAKLKDEGLAIIASSKKDDTYTEVFAEDGTLSLRRKVANGSWITIKIFSTVRGATRYIENNFNAEDWGGVWPRITLFDDRY